jgi:hypothetical protein
LHFISMACCIYPLLVKSKSFSCSISILKRVGDTNLLTDTEKTELQTMIKEINIHIKNYTDLCKSIQDIVKNYL